MKLKPKVRSAKIISVICVEYAVGDGIVVPVHPVFEYWSLEGELLAKVDEWAESERR